MPYTRIYTGITLATVDTFIPEETYETLSDALAGYGVSQSETISITDNSWHTLTYSPTAKGSAVVRLTSTNLSAVFVCTKNASSNSVSKISSVNNGAVYLSARWSGNSIEVSCVNNSDSFNLTVSI